MSLGDIVNRTPQPATIESLAADLDSLGIRPDETLLVHSSLSSLGWVCGGPVAVLRALEQAVGRRGTLVMPAQTSENSNPAVWCNPPVPEDWWSVIAAATPAYDPARTPSAGMGQIAELFRGWPGTRRSAHPQHSFAARGRLAGRILRHHPLEDSLGDPSPLGALYRERARVLLLGTGWDSCTALHLGEYRSDWPGRSWTTECAAVTLPSWPRPRRRWVSFRILQTATADFPALGADFEAALPLRRGPVGLADCRLVDMVTLVDFAVDWFAAKRGA